LRDVVVFGGEFRFYRMADDEYRPMSAGSSSIKKPKPTIESNPKELIHMKNLHALILATVVLLAAPVASFAQTGHWTSVGSAGTTIDETDLRIYAVDGGDLFFAPGKGGTINARYNVVNTANVNLEMPIWNTLEIGYTDLSAAGSIQALLWKVDPCTGARVLLCSVTSDDNGPACKTCQFPNNSFNFLTNLYFVGVVITRNNEGANPILHTLRIF
jgi:hypothetical protein